MTTTTKLDYAPAPKPSTSKAMLWTGRVISTLVVLFMGVMPIVVYFTQRQMMTEGMTKYGYPAGAGTPILIAQVVSAVLYAIPQTSVLGAILLTGYLGGAVATHVRAGEPFWFAVIVGVLVWLGLWFRSARIRELVPIRKQQNS
jgi:hypothetical protein